MVILESYNKHCLNLKDKSLYRTLKYDSSFNPLFDFTSNDYLDLSCHSKVIERAQTYAEVYGVGGRASRLVNKGLPIYEELEEKIAVFKNKEAALIFNSGYQTNSTVLGALLNKQVLGDDPLVFSDRLNHASLHHGCQLAGVQQNRFQHLDLNHLNHLLEKYKNSSQPKFILTESVFSMDGDVADLSALTQIADHYGAFLYVDEAHATGIFGEKGYGLTCSYGDKVHLAMGTFSKALGASGGYIACSKALKDYLVNTCTGFIYSTALSPMLIGAIDAAWDLLPSLEEERKYLTDLSLYLRQKLHEKGYDTGSSSTHIIPVILKDAQKTLQVQSFLADKNIKVAAIRPPTVSPLTSRLRLSLRSSHSYEDVDYFLENLQKCQ